ncbi:MAG: prepilin-type N-terminal cleavage/methylation domain-containing protein [Candidatus Omnitrophota bacterium]
MRGFIRLQEAARAAKRNSAAGFTLVEVLVTSVILAVLVTALFLVLNLGQSSWTNADTGIQLRQEIARALMFMSQELKQTSAAKIDLTLNSSAGSISFRIPQDPDGDGYVVDASGNIDWSPEINYSLNSSGQVLREYGGVTSIIANNISSLAFTRILSEVLQIDLTASRVSNTGVTLRDADQIIVKLRN